MFLIFNYNDIIVAFNFKFLTRTQFYDFDLQRHEWPRVLKAKKIFYFEKRSSILQRRRCT
jgi:hypothetical protein